jgi:hypothetical protein
MDIMGKLKGPSGRLSNFTARFFILDKVPCASIESLLQAFKFNDPEVQRQICLLKGKEAKAKGQERNDAWQSRQLLWWQGKEYPRDSLAYQLLLDRIYETVFWIPAYAGDLLATGDEILTHSIGTQDPCKTVLTEEEFCSRLMRIRKEFKEKPVYLSLEDMDKAAMLIETDGDEAFYTVAERFGKANAQLLLIAHLRRKMGSTATWPPKPEISADAIKYVRGM